MTLMTPKKVNGEIILTDVDGVLLNWNFMFTNWMKAKGFTQQKDNVYSLASCWGISEGHATGLVQTFNTSAAVGFCPAYDDAVHYVQRLAWRGYKFQTITAMGGDLYSEELRRKNLERIFGPDIFVGHTFIGLNACKKEALSAYSGTRCWWIEDKVKNAVDGLEFGLRPILLKHPHNDTFEHPEILAVSGWDAIYSIITGEEYLY